MLEASKIIWEPGTTWCSLVPPTPQRAGDRAAWNLPEMEWVPQVPMGGLATASSLGEEAGMKGAGFNWRRRRKKGTPGVGREMIGTKAHWAHPQMRVRVTDEGRGVPEGKKKKKIAGRQGGVAVSWPNSPS